MRYFLKLYTTLKASVFDSEYQFIPFGIIGLIGYTAYYFVWNATLPGAYENAMLRIAAIVLFIGLITTKLWPKKIRTIIPFYWYLSVMYTLPFFFTYMLLKNNFSNIWIQNSMTALLFGVLLLNFFELILVFISGILLALVAYIYTTPYTNFPHSVLATSIAYAAVLGASALLTYNKNQKTNERLESTKLFAASIAHELRTPLRSLASGAGGIKKYLPTLLQTYGIAEKQKLDIPVIAPSNLQYLNTILDNMEFETQSAFTTISMLLINANESAIGEGYQLLSVTHCVQLALNRYPFTAAEKALVHWQAGPDFNFRGNEQLMIHVMFNLFKNALYYLKAADKGDITIWLAQDAGHNYLYFKDTGTGIPAEQLPHIFDRFYSKTQHGTGIGLAFCSLAIKSFGGKISCQSIEGEFAEFIMRFPLISAA